MSFLKCPPELFFSKNDPSDPRLGDLVKSDGSLSMRSTIFAGYPDDEGVRLNGGRPGAAEGPNAIRKSLYKMTSSKNLPPLYDRGNVDLELSLQDRHRYVQSAVGEALQSGHRWIGLGGGHDYGYPDGAGFLESAKGSGKKPLVINFDAHLDVRPTTNGPTSGTPFFRLLSDFEDFDFIEVGIQKHCNSQTHLEWAKEKGAKILSLEDLLISGKAPEETFFEHLGELLVPRRQAFLSVDMDCFSSAYAPGCSAVYPLGLEPWAFFKIYQTLLSRLDIRILGIYEVAPCFDHDFRTSKLASQIVYEFLSS